MIKKKYYIINTIYYLLWKGDSRCSLGGCRRGQETLTAEIMMRASNALATAPRTLSIICFMRHVVNELLNVLSLVSYTSFDIHSYIYTTAGGVEQQKRKMSWSISCVLVSALILQQLMVFAHSGNWR